MNIMVLIVSSSALALIPVSQSFAQTVPDGNAQAAIDADQGIEDIVVTAQKRSENLQKVPITITAVASETIANSGIVSTQGLSAVLPGLQVLNIGGSLTPRVRGVGSGFTSPGTESPVVTFVDGVYHAFAADIEIDPADVEQVALLKGPQGTLFGRNATGGVLQITTRRPSHEFGGSLETSLDQYLTSRSNAYVTGGLSEAVAASLSVSFATQGKGYGTNFATGNDTYKLDHSASAIAKVHGSIGDRTTVDLAADFRSTEGPQGRNFRTFPGLGTINPAPEPGNAWDSDRFFDADIDFKGGGASLRIDHDFGFATLNAISGYRDGSNKFEFTAVSSPVKSNLLVADYRSQQFTQEVQLVSPSSGRLTWTIGAYYFWNKANVDYTYEFYDPKANPGLFAIDVTTRQKTNSVAAFGQATYRILDGTRITGGLRYTHDKLSFAGTNLVSPRSAPGVVVPVRQNGEDTLDKPTWRIALDHDLSSRVMLYATYNRGVKSGGFNTTTVGDPPVLAERLDAYEAGLKSQFLDNRVRLNIGGFYYDYSNIQVPVFNGGVPALRNAGAAENYGVDLDVEARVSERLRLSASANLLHAEFQRFDNAPIGVPNPGFQGASFPPGLSAAGRTLPFSPKLTYNLAADYSFDTSAGRVNLNVNDGYNSGFYFESDNFLRQKSYHFINASVTWTSPDTKLTIRAFADNILNEAVASQAVSITTGYTADYTNPPFRIGAGAKVSF